jgi:peptidoglycan hydrolase-like protein with peptidoglycan-binding domain
VRPPYDGQGAAPAATPRTAPPEPHARLPYPKLPPGVILRAGTPYHDEVAIYQRRMLRRGWQGIGAVDGEFGPNAVTVTKAFQAEKGLEADGEVGPQTWKAAFELPVS